MSRARNQILERLKQANTLPKNSEHLPFEPWGFDGSKSEQEKMNRFCAALTASHADVRTIQSKALGDTLSGLCTEKNWQRAAIGTDGEWHSTFCQGLQAVELTEYNQAIEQWKTPLFDQIDVGVTHVLAGIADTGALVLWPSEHEPRTLSLVPPCHVAVMHASTLYNHFLEVMEVQNWAASMPTNALLISGPSKTADIQQTLAYGAHGPSELIVLILEDK
ncbi:LutC/YkgG family protein [Vibrio sp.]|uniref:LutC/YkgG family protein n=1 Tax=Vibrio sp. TaxID=678 RepID=UPI003D0BA7F9